MKNRWQVILVLLVFSVIPMAFADEADDLAEMQRQLNADVMAKPFFAPEDSKVDAYIEEAMKKDLKPPEYKGNNWQAGYTCHDMLRYSWREYRNCRYYHRYYGRYY